MNLGLVYDGQHDLVWGVLCHLKEAALIVLRPDARETKLTPLK